MTKRWWMAAVAGSGVLLAAVWAAPGSSAADAASSAKAQKPINGTPGPKRATPLIIPDNPAATSEQSAAAAAPVTGTTLTVKYAVVNADGTRDRGKVVKSVTRLATGYYEALFNKADIRSCAWTATIANPDAGGQTQGAIQLALRAGTTNGVFIASTDLSGANTDHSFHLVLTCYV